ncbi:major capsid protein [Nocardia sp. NPDC050697]|uniref:major capsid protein n=1 Tax=Nocardia sp. NPDC050697 TaxID=3155158 RepID=UPI0033D7338F
MSLFLDQTAPIGAADVLSFTQDQPIPSNNLLTQMFPRRDFDTDYVDFSTLKTTNRVLKFRNWDGAFAPVSRDSYDAKRTKMLPLGGFLEEGEWERRQIEHAATAGTNIARIQAAVYNDLENLTKYAFNRIELAWGDVLSDGILTINENGVQQTLDFGIPAGQKVTPATLWSDHANSTPLTDLLTWLDVWGGPNGVPPGQFKTSLEVVRHLMQNEQLINAIKGEQMGVTWLSITEINNFLSGFGLPGFVVPDPPGTPGGSIYNSNFDVDGSTTRVIASNKLLFLPADTSTLGFTAWGTPTTAYELNSKNVQVQTAPGVVGVLVREDNPPFRKHAYVDAVALPILADTRKILIATVA